MLYTGKTATHEVYALTFFVIVHYCDMENCCNLNPINKIVT